MSKRIEGSPEVYHTAELQESCRLKSVLPRNTPSKPDRPKSETIPPDAKILTAFLTKVLSYDPPQSITPLWIEPLDFLDVR